ncbi:hypothetical protein BGY98DRAFT_1177644 [Russula aff. rugulosa BPL654]|nr:hypothetical protein BGY98DRAFT_1177644 [Russula aff. rugulosa BPL654]
MATIMGPPRGRVRGRAKPIQGHSASFRFGTDGGFFVVNFSNQSWVLDCNVLGIGTVIPQNLWVPSTVTDRRQHVQDADLQMPIFFPAHGRKARPYSRGGCWWSVPYPQCSAPLGPQTTTHIRIGWPGYREFKRQVQIRDETALRNTVTLSKFVQHVGRSVDAFLRTAQGDSEYPTPQWRIGERAGKRDKSRESFTRLYSDVYQDVVPKALMPTAYPEI